MDIVLKRSGALGDIINTFVVIEKLYNIGYDITLIVDEKYLEIGKLSPYIKKVYSKNEYTGKIDIEYDGVYEFVKNGNKFERKECKPEYWIDKTNLYLKKFGKKLDYNIKNPSLLIHEIKNKKRLQFLNQYPKPWHIFVHGSLNDITRRIPTHIIEKVAKEIKGTSFILDYEQDLKGIIKLPIHEIYDIVSFIYLCDTITTPVTGPLHIANAFSKKTITLNQSSIVNLIFPDHKMIVLKDICNCIGCVSWNKCKQTNDTYKIPCHQINYKEIIGYLEC